ncbi:LysM domain-containing protein [Sulfitobacter sp. PS-8MA]|uniref:LysM domain-containing protein n=1 Tax=Sulfitobacter sp. PS-8MA TaxID=3237707 RepID=UPI0034C6A84E
MRAAPAAARRTDTTRSTANAQGTYRVEQGDTPYAIASALGISLFELLNENEDLDPLRMAVGDVLEVPQQRTSGRAASA